MKSLVGPAIVALALAGAGAVFSTIGKTEQRLADAHKQLALLAYGDASDESQASLTASPLVQRFGGFGQDDAKDARQVQATASYWSGGYAALEPKRDTGGAITETDPDVLMFAANAAFRASQGETDRNSAIRRLDTVVKEYGEVLKNNGSQPDAAYNYEYAIRVRDTLAKAKPPAKGAASKSASKNANAAPEPATESDLPSGPTLHGKPGGPPAAASMAQFKIVIPKRGEERKDDPQAGKGSTKIRKG